MPHLSPWQVPVIGWYTLTQKTQQTYCKQGIEFKHHSNKPWRQDLEACWEGVQQSMASWSPKQLHWLPVKGVILIHFFLLY